LVLLASLLGACQQTEEPLIHQESFVFGTRIEVQIYGETPERGHAAAAEVLREFDRLHRTYHAWQPSRLTILNAALAAGHTTEVSDELAKLIRTAQKIATQGNGLFDPGIGQLIALWGFQSDEFKPNLPDAQKLAEWSASRPSIRNIRVVGKQVSSDNPRVALDFGGYLKGVALDRAAHLLKARGIHNALINIGGNVMALGSKGSTPWRVGIQHPRAASPLASLDLRDGEAIGSSGDYQRYFMLNGQRYSHLLDPRTAHPTQESQAITVLIPPGVETGMLSDATSKPLFIAGSQWLGEARKLGITQALRVDADGRLFVTPALRARLKMSRDAPQVTVTPLQ
jgi:thiamine biosynthesis lipoprotein